MLCVIIAKGVSMMKIYAIRHGQTDQNLNKIVQGWTNHPLNEFGIKQAYQMGHYLKHHNYHFDRIISSPLVRSVKTAEIIQSIMNTNHLIEIDTSFIERDFGVFEGESVDETIKIISVKNFKRDGYEHDEALLQRIECGVKNLYKKYPNDSILLSCHSHVSKSLLVLSDPITYSFRTFLNNASMCIFDYDGLNLKTVAYNIEADEK